MAFDETLTADQEQFLARLRELDSNEGWLLFINAGFSMADALALQRMELIETSRQMGMPAARLNIWIKHDGGACPVDGEQRVMVKWKDEDESGITTHRAGAFNWARIASYRLAPNPEHSQ
jgi:hypothetical protein